MAGCLCAGHHVAGVFSKVGSNGVLEPIPSVVHYGGFELHKVHRQTIRVCNVAGYSSRCHIIPPTTPFFKASRRPQTVFVIEHNAGPLSPFPPFPAIIGSMQWRNPFLSSHPDVPTMATQIAAVTRRGFIAPGLSEDITIEFCPTEHRYYYDCIRIHSEEENLLVPIHAYPVMNDIKFPAAIDFGKCQVGELHVKEVHISCKVPIDFEYEVIVRQDNRQFHVSDTRGVVPANGVSTVTVQYQPSELATAVMELEVSCPTPRGCMGQSLRPASRPLNG